jgi:hypothetical protein
VVVPRPIRRAVPLALALLVALCVGASTASAAPCGRIVVSNDEWPLSDTGFTQARDANAATFADNVARWFTEGANGRFLVYSNNFGLTEPSLTNALTAAGHTVDVQQSGSVTLEQLRGYDGVFVGGRHGMGTTALLANYVQGGGHVYLAGGTGAFSGNAMIEGSIWGADFLNLFNLRFGTAFNTITGLVPTVSAHPIFGGVAQLYQDGGLSVAEIDPADEHTDILVSSGGQGLYAVYDSCGNDPDGDGVLNPADNCPVDANPDQADNDGDGLGDACDPDDDDDNVLDPGDNCPVDANPDQAEHDGDGQGDACDPDDDNDGAADGGDNCPVTANPDQADAPDGDGEGDVCDTDDDGDRADDSADNCPATANPDQRDTDGDGAGDACDATPGETLCKRVRGIGGLSGKPRAAFLFDARHRSARRGPRGHVVYHDSAAKLTFHSLAVTSVRVEGAKAILSGEGKRGRARVDFTVEVEDLGRRGSGDTFRIDLSDGYSAAGTVRHGDVKVACGADRHGDGHGDSSSD